jgi:hypothetical protein
MIILTRSFEMDSRLRGNNKKERSFVSFVAIRPALRGIRVPKVSSVFGCGYAAPQQSALIGVPSSSPSSSVAATRR